MIEHYVRPLYQKVLIIPLTKRIGCHPHFITLFALIFGIFIPPLLSLGCAKLALFCLALSGYFDTLDGSLARDRKISSPKGAVFDILTDRFVESAIILGLYLVDPSSRALLSLLMLVSVLICVTSFLVVGIFVENQGKKSFHYSQGLMERAEAFLFFALMIVFPEAFTSLAIIFIGLVFLTAGIRIREFTKEN